MQIEKNKVVGIDYTLTDKEGTVIDSSQGKEPLKYIHGIGALIPGLEKELAGKATGDKLTVSIAPEDGYGQRNEELRQSIPSAQFPPEPEPQVGMQFQANGPEGPIVVTIVDVAPDHVVVDGNHPLAGVTLNFDVEIKEVRDASTEELEHGHVHGAGGHQH